MSTDHRRVLIDNPGLPGMKTLFVLFYRGKLIEVVALDETNQLLDPDDFDQAAINALVKKARAGKIGRKGNWRYGVGEGFREWSEAEEKDFIRRLSLPPITIVHGRSRPTGPRAAVPEAASTGPNNRGTSRLQSPEDQR